MGLLVAHLIAVLLHMIFSDGGYGADEDGSILLNFCKPVKHEISCSYYQTIQVARSA